MPELQVPTASSTKAPYVLLGVAGIVALLGALLTYVLLREYGDTNASGLLQGLKDATVPAGLVLVLAAVAYSLHRSRPVALMAGAAVLASVFAAALAGQAAVTAKYASYPLTPDCSAPDPTTAAKGGALDPTTRDGLVKIQAALDAMQHPSRFIGTLEVGSLEPRGASCLAGLATDDLGGAITFYRAQAQAHGWTLNEETTTRLVATNGRLTLTVDQGDGATPRVRMTYVPR